MFVLNAKPRKRVGTMDSKRMLMIVAVFFIIQCFIDGILIFNIINSNNEQEANMNVLRDFSSTLKVMDKKIVETMNAHNVEVESWYVANSHIEETTKKFFQAMNSLSNQGNLTEFETCIADYNEYYQLLTPHMNPDGDVDGYIIWMYEPKDFSGIGFVMLTKDYAKYVVYACGGYDYNKTAEEITFIAPEVLT